MSVVGRSLKLKGGTILTSVVSFSSFLRCDMSNTVAAMALVHAFTTSQSVDAHVILFHCIFKIVAAHTGTPVHFFHIHGMGIESVIADRHWGQALGRFLFLSLEDIYLRSDNSIGLGRFCVELC